MNGRTVLLAVTCCLAFSARADDVDPKLLRIDPEKHQLEVDFYSKDTGAPRDVAIAEMDRQRFAQEGIDALREEFEDRLAGLYWSSYPNQAINVRLTGAIPVAPRKIETIAGDVPVLFTIGARMTAVEQRSRLRESWAALRAMVPGLIGAGVDERDGVVLIDARSPDGDPAPYESERANIERVLGMPVRFSVINAVKEREVNQPTRPFPTSSLEKGAPYQAVAPGILPGGWIMDSGTQRCTGGFTVRDPVSGKRGGVDRWALSKFYGLHQLSSPSQSIAFGRAHNNDGG